MSVDSSSIVIATRKSPLALRQAKAAAESLTAHLKVEVNLSPMTTTGDKQAAWSLQERGGKGLFTKELEQALLEKRADVAVHSAKDLPTEIPEGLALAGFLEREDPRDVLVMRNEVETPGILATGSPRRKAQLRERFPDAKWVELRGNVETRLLRIAELKEADATILAAAGLKRLAITDFPGLRFEFLPLEQNVPAAGQAAIALQCRIEDVERFVPACDLDTNQRVSLERAVLEKMGGGCHVAMGVHCRGNELLVYHEKHGMRSIDLNGLSMKESINATMDALLEP